MLHLQPRPKQAISTTSQDVIRLFKKTLTIKKTGTFVAM